MVGNFGKESGNDFREGILLRNFEISTSVFENWDKSHRNEKLVKAVREQPQPKWRQVIDYGKSLVVHFTKRRHTPNTILTTLFKKTKSIFRKRFLHFSTLTSRTKLRFLYQSPPPQQKKHE